MVKLNLGLIGTGVVGRGVIELLKRNGLILQRRSGVRLEIKTLCSRSIFDRRNEPWAKAYHLTHDYNEVISDTSIDVVVELIGGVTKARDVVEKSLKHGKHVVTANKSLLSKHGVELFKLACDNKVELFFEASIGGGIPIIKVLRESLAGNRIQALYCIINGTTNYILTKMIAEDRAFAPVLQEARQRGFAEADPRLDISGADAAQKTGLLAQLAFDSKVDSRHVYFEGIEKIDSIDIKEARAFGYKMKLMGIAKDLGKGKIDVRVHPTLIPVDSELASVDNEYNAVLIKSDFLGDSLYYGKGAGARPTASAVVSDLNDLAHIAIGGNDFNPHSYRMFQSKTVISMDEIVCKYYIRLHVQEKAGVLAHITAVFAGNGISVEILRQNESGKKNMVPIIFITHPALEKSIKRSIGELRKFSFIKFKPIVYRIDNLK